VRTDQHDAPACRESDVGGRPLDRHGARYAETRVRGTIEVIAGEPPRAGNHDLSVRLQHQAPGADVRDDAIQPEGGIDRAIHVVARQPLTRDHDLAVGLDGGAAAAADGDDAAVAEVRIEIAVSSRCRLGQRHEQRQDQDSRPD
jgi:hypothetical protein